MTKNVGISVSLPDNRSYLKEAGYSIEEEEAIYNAVVEDVYKNPRWYLDNLDYLVSFRVSWINYRGRASYPYKFTTKTDKKTKSL